ncbi:MAG: hypothetical protein IK007_06545 [Lachnospiraceae bacterium]|nr:hypothetical protein [Lachnospiraceae bacterium]
MNDNLQNETDSGLAPVKKKKSLSKRLLKAFIIFIAVIAVILLGARLYFRIPVSEYYKHSEKEFTIPDINSGFIAQGLTYDARSDCFFMTGYMNDKSASPIYMVEKSTNKYVKKLLMQNPDGSEFHGHAGGMTMHGDYIYVAGSGDSCLYVFLYKDAINAPDNGAIKSIGTFPMPDDMSVAFTSSDENVIYAGEFYRAENYKTDESHKMTTSAGDYNQALMFAYRFSDSADALYGIEPEPFEVYSITDLVQGMDIYNGKLYLSTSYGLAFSHIYVYDKPQSTKNLEIAGLTLPLYELDSSTLTNTFKYPPMSEEIVCIDNRIYTMCESASNKYIFGKLTGAHKCYSTDISWK